MTNKQHLVKEVKQIHKTLYGYKAKDLERTIPYLKKSWGFQNNRADRKSNFIYKAEGFDDILYEHNKNPFDDLDYTVRRYFNHVTSATAEDIFCSYNICEKEKNKKHKEIDFYILGQPFDLKLSSFPKRYTKTKKDFINDRAYRNDIILWLYKNQSKEGRYHEGNRLFIVCKDGDGKDSFKNNLLKMDFPSIHKKTENYLTYTLKKHNDTNIAFNQIALPNGKKVFSDLIFIDK